MRTFALGLITLVCLFTFTSCKKKHIHPDFGQKIFFEYSYINHAWGYQYNHWIIDNKGNVRAINKEEKYTSIDPNNLNDYLPLFDNLIYKIDKEEFNYYKSLIASAAKGNVTEEVQYRADFGSSTYNCYASSGRNYQLVTLSVMSDVVDKTNESTDAKTIDKWLKELNNKIYFTQVRP